MNESNLILSFWKKEQTEFNRNLSILKQHCNKEAVHDIRVACKKLRAYLKLYILLKKEPEWGYLLNNTEELFDILGKQRDVEICLDLIVNYEKENQCQLIEIKQYLALMLKKTLGWSNQSIHLYHKRELSKIALLFKEDNSLGDKDALIKQIQAIIDYHLASVKTLFKQPHKIRICLKELYYWTTIVTDGDLKNEYHQKELHTILDYLGEWQDNEILLVKAKHFRRDYLPNPFKEAALVKIFEARIKEKKEMLKKAAISKTKNWLKKIIEVENTKSEV
jgi:CHAD domain-containing protein